MVFIRPEHEYSNKLQAFFITNDEVENDDDGEVDVDVDALPNIKTNLEFIYIY